MPRNIEGQCAVNVAGHVTYGVTVVARLRHDGGTPLSRRGNGSLLQRNPTTRSRTIRILLSARWKSRRGPWHATCSFECGAPGVTPLSQCDRVVFYQARKERVMKRLLVLPLVLFLAGASNVLAQDVRYNFAKETNFATFKTYKWVPIKSAAAPERSGRQTDQGRRRSRTCHERPHADGGRHCGPVYRLPGRRLYRETVHVVRHRLRLWSRLVRWRSGTAVVA